MWLFDTRCVYVALSVCVREEELITWHGAVILTVYIMFERVGREEEDGKKREWKMRSNFLIELTVTVLFKFIFLWHSLDFMSRLRVLCSYAVKCGFRWWRQWVWGRSGSLVCSIQTVKATSRGSNWTKRWETLTSSVWSYMNIFSLHIFNLVFWAFFRTHTCLHMFTYRREGGG